MSMQPLCRHKKSCATLVLHATKNLVPIFLPSHILSWLFISIFFCTCLHDLDTLLFLCKLRSNSDTWDASHNLHALPLNTRIGTSQLLTRSGTSNDTRNDTRKLISDGNIACALCRWGGKSCIPTNSKFQSPNSKL